MEPTGAFAPAVLERWRRRENLLPGAFLAALAAAGWAYTIHQARGAGMGEATGPALFLAGWATMMVAMMLPATLPLFLLYRTLSRHRSGAGVAALLAGYLLVWIAAGLPVYAYSLLMEGMSPLLAVLPGLLLVAGGIYQFTALKRTCHVRCGSPLFFLMQRWRAGPSGALRLGVLHGVDCLGCCAGLMAGLVALGMMNPAWMLTAAVIVFAEKTLPGGHRLVRPLGVLMIAGGAVILGTALSGVWEAV
ncbi:DUF2182 domain-containing protein [Rubrobacter naiadicus]|uniref:DUF2182 domain-containing protein n=1 Tax=Rubrobacter naiadicus TaxID=1392641 RepID=UPI00235F5A5E|nr:DUF2182 domain-containing protein [Rubrobacter naiadicus]